MTVDTGKKPTKDLAKKIDVDYRLGGTSDGLKAALTVLNAESGAVGADLVSQVRARYVSGKASPPDRKGLLAVLHPRLSSFDEVAAMALVAARGLGRRVYAVQTEDRWYMVLLGIPRADLPAATRKAHADDGDFDRDGDDGGLPEPFYDDYPDGKYANDQYIAYYEPDGSYHLFGES